MGNLKRMLAKSSMVNRNLRPARIIILSFIGVILAGTLLLGLPIATKGPGAANLFTAFFTATSATCVTGLTLVDTYEYWGFFGQLVILLMIQIGGLGFMSFISLFYFLLDKRVRLRERLVIMESMNLSTVEGVVGLVRHVLIGTLCFEIAGAAILSWCFIPEFGALGGIWRGIFHSVSAFCNAGFEIMGPHNMFSTMITYVDNPVVLITLAVLILVGSVGFYVWEDIITRKKFRRLHVHSKLALIITAILVVLGTLMYLGFEGNNPDSIGNLTAGQRVLVSFFQSVSTRTTGFDVIGQLTLTEDTKALSMLLMFIGGSSGSTAGGVKTVTIGILVLSVISVIRGRRDLTVFEKKIPQRQIINATTLISIGIMLTISGGIVLCAANNVSLLDALFESVSAYSTAGMEAGFLRAASVGSQLLVIFFMFFGKIGVLSLSIAFMMKGGKAVDYTYPAENVIIG